MSRVRAPSPALGLLQEESQVKGSRPPRGIAAASVSPGNFFPVRVVDDRLGRVAQLVEHTLGKGEVIGSIPIASSFCSSAGRGKNDALMARL